MDEEELKAQQEAAARKAADAETDTQAKQTDNDGKPALSDKEASLLREVMEKKSALTETKQALAAAEAQAKELAKQLEQFKGIDLGQVKELLTEKQKREQEDMEKRGEFDRVKEQMREQHQAQLAEIQAQLSGELDNLRNALAERENAITELTIGRSFSESAFIRESLTLTPSKARVIYGSHFEIADGKVVAYDKPVGSPERTVLVDANGDALTFENAMKKLVELDPDRDNLLKSKLRPGSGSDNDTAAKKPEPKQELSGRSRIAAAIAAGNLPKATS